MPENLSKTSVEDLIQMMKELEKRVKKAEAEILLLKQQAA